MRPSGKAYDFIKHEEGLILHPYHDEAEVPTIGYGSTMYKTGKRVTMQDKPITEPEAFDLLKWEVDNKTAAVSGALKNVVLNQNQFDALVSLAYNIGVGAFAGSTVAKRVKANPQDPTIRNAFMMWNKVHKDGKLVVSDTLTGRRKREADLYFS